MKNVRLKIFILSMHFAAILLSALRSQALAFEGPVAYGAGFAAMNGAAAASPSEESVSVNPSVLSIVNQKSFLLSGIHGVEGQSNVQFLGVIPTKQFGLGAGYSKTTVKDIPLRDAFNTSLGSSEFYSQKASFVGSGRLGNSVAAGGAVHYTTLGIDGEAFDSKALMDFGVFSQIRGWNVGSALLRWGEKRSSEVRLGFQKPGKIGVGFDAIWPMTGSLYGALSFDYQIQQILALRLAYHSGPEDMDRFGLINGIAFGFKLQHRRFSLEYAAIPQGDLGLAHRFSISFRGKPIERTWALEPLTRTEKRRLIFKSSIKKEPAQEVTKETQLAAAVRHTPSTSAQESSAPDLPLTADSLCPAPQPQLYSGEFSREEAAKSEFLDRRADLSRRLDASDISHGDPDALQKIRSAISEAEHLYQATNIAAAGFGALARSETWISEYESRTAALNLSRRTLVEKDFDWNAFEQEVRSHFAVLSQEIQVAREGQEIVLNLPNVTCIGTSRFSVQTARILSQIAVFLRSKKHCNLVIVESGDGKGSGCADSVKTFLFNERLDLNMTLETSIGDPKISIKIRDIGQSAVVESAAPHQSVEVITHVTTFFDPGETDLTPEYQSMLSAFSSQIKGMKELKILIHGSNDILGDPGYRAKVAQCRAKRIEELLVGTGISRESIVVTASGDEWRAPNDSPAGRARNRRCDITFKFMSPSE